MTMSGIDQGLSGPPLRPHGARPAKKPPALLLYLARFVRNPLSALPEQVYEDWVVPYGKGAAHVVWVMQPGLIERILLREHERFPKTPVEVRVLGPALGKGILTSVGDDWRWQRKAAAPLFRYAELLSYVPQMATAGEEQLVRWRKAQRGSLAEIEDDMTETTFAVISRTVLAGCDEAEGEVIKQASQEFLDPIGWSIAGAMLGVPRWIWHPGKRSMLRAASRLRTAVTRLALRRRAEGGIGDDILGRLLAARHPETREPMSQSQIVDNLATFLTAGHETTAKALTWTLYLLARSPFWQDRVRAEVSRIAGTRPIAPDDIDRLTLTGQVLKESMRLYPPAPVLTRVTAEEVELDGRRIGAGTLIVMPIYVVHRHRKLWDEPDLFAPDRFQPEREATYARSQFMPFGFGPRTCIGAGFAMIEATALLATLVRGAQFDWDGRHEPEPVARVTLKPRGGMPLRVTPLSGL